MQTLSNVPQGGKLPLVGNTGMDKLGMTMMTAWAELGEMKLDHYPDQHSGGNHVENWSIKGIRSNFRKPEKNSRS